DRVNAPRQRCPRVQRQPGRQGRAGRHSPCEGRDAVRRGEREGYALTHRNVAQLRGAERESQDPWVRIAHRQREELSYGGRPEDRLDGEVEVAVNRGGAADGP